MKMKTLLIGMLVASPAFVYWSGWIDGSPTADPRIQSASPPKSSLPPAPSVVSIPVEVIATGKAPEWIFVQVGN
jgi:hypothetical protein